MDFREIKVGSDEYQQECDLRQEALRRPLGLKLFDEDLSKEINQRHYGLFEANWLIACVIAVPGDQHAVRLRQMAVSIKKQGLGYGRKLVGLVEAELVKSGCVLVSLHARETALGFYERLGYISEGKRFYEVGIPHRNMVKRLNRPC